MLAPSLARADARSAALRLAIVPVSPGGSWQAPPLYSAGQLDTVQLAIYLDAELHGQDVEQYLADRSILCRASYRVEVFALAAVDGGELPAAPAAVVESGEGLQLPADLLQRGGNYAWRAVAQLGEEATVVSAPLYFSIEPQPQLVPELLSLEGRAVAARLLRMGCEQQRAAAALTVAMGGLPLYETFPTATDSFICAPLRGTESASPYPDQLQSGGITLPLLAELGSVLKAIEIARYEVLAQHDAQQHLKRVDDQLRALVQSLTHGPVLGRSQTDLVEISAQLRGSAARENTLALLSQLQLAIDALIGTGMLDLGQDYQASYRAYALRSEARLLQLEEMAPYFATLAGPEQATAWATLIEEQRAALVLLRDEVERGRLAKPQLRDRIGEYRRRLAEQVNAQYSFLEGASCAVQSDRLRRLASGDQAQLKRLEQELVTCQLFRLLIALWPET